ncbi:hypothetical protein RhiirA4_478839 [Rhizophagus irregularis]|uniref:DUF8211 domain-containing protein n=1 Tax=Rhizophagus irregularis TaxID=588596 RepID=A0A2I1HFJ7_9GLOM|nr:hypothetical protein RhiirA4_478839 [Rhizophagus irregularis]
MTSLKNSPSLEKKYPLDVLVQKFHVTRPNRAGYNKIYEIRRSKSFFFELVDQISNTNEIHLKIHTNDYHMKTTPIKYPNTSKLPNDKYQISVMLTHFFSLQRVLPRRIQQKYFNFIRDKLIDRKSIIMSRAGKVCSRNTSTRNFFNFSYKRYRFYFGIFIPCSHDYFTPGLLLPKGTCNVPAPFMMSDFRRACVIHQPQFFKHNTFQNTKKSKTKGKNKIINNKINHANLLYSRWRKSEKKTIFSRRLGISFEQSIYARTDNGTRRTFNKHMYKKKLYNFSLCRSNNIGTNKAQEIRFERAKKRVFNSKEHNPRNRRYHRLITAQRYRFLYTPSQSINKPIKHLQYSRGWRQSNYEFRTPLLSNFLPRRDALSEDVSFMNLVLTVEPYNPIPDKFFPERYRNIIPKDPIYSEQDQKRAKRLREDLIKEERQAREEAKYHGTSYHRINRRKAVIFNYTCMNTQFDDTMKEYIEYYNTYDDLKNKNHYHSKMVDLGYNVPRGKAFHDRYIKNFYPLPPGAPDDTSDDTYELEKRPRKRRFPYIIHHYGSSDDFCRSKRQRLSSASLDDSTEGDAIKLNQLTF